MLINLINLLKEKWLYIIQLMILKPLFGGAYRREGGRRRRRREMGKKNKKPGKGKEKTERKTAKADEKRSRRESKKVSQEDDIDAILVVTNPLIMTSFFSSLIFPNCCSGLDICCCCCSNKCSVESGWKISCRWKRCGIEVEGWWRGIRTVGLWNLVNWDNMNANCCILDIHKSFLIALVFVTGINFDLTSNPLVNSRWSFWFCDYHIMNDLLCKCFVVF